MSPIDFNLNIAVGVFDIYAYSAPMAMLALATHSGPVLQIYKYIVDHISLALI